MRLTGCGSVIGDQAVVVLVVPVVVVQRCTVGSVQDCRMGRAR